MANETNEKEGHKKWEIIMNVAKKAIGNREMKNKKR